MKKILVILLAVLVGLSTLSGCTTSPDVVASASSSSASEPTPTPTPEPTPTPAPTPPPTPEPVAPSGIIAAIADWNNSMTYTVVGIDPTTGEQETLAFFDAYALTDSEAGYTFDFKKPSPSGVWTVCYASYRDMFSSDYSKIATQKVFAGNRESHAGWIDEDGNFFDVTEALGLQSQSDFDDPKQYAPVGFTEDGLFVYIDRSEIPSGPLFYSVPVDDVRPENIQEMPWESRYLHKDPDIWGWMKEDYPPTDWIDETHFLADCEMVKDFATLTVSVIVDTETEEAVEYVPGSSRHSWSGVMSPDGTQIAFMSAPINGDEPSDLFVTSIDGGDPVRVPNSLPASANDDGFPQTEVGGLGTCVTLIDWLE